MVKTPKKAAPGGDERNAYVRRLKTTNASSKSSENSSLPNKRHRESENLNRPKLSGVNKKVPGKAIKSKIHKPAKLGIHQPSKNIGESSGSNQNSRKIASSTQNLKSPTKNMQPETEEADVKLDASGQKEEAQEQSLNKERTTNEDLTDAPVEVSASDSKENVDNAEEKNTNVDETGVRNENESHNHSNQEKQDQEENEIILTIDESPSKSTSEKKEEPVEEVKNVISNEGVPSESQTDTESCSVDIVESTTSEISETTESSSQNEVLKEKQMKPNDEVMYNSNIALKDVQIKLNDCLKDNFKQTNASESERNTPEPLSKDMSFGKTLRNISGRSGLGRMRHNGPVERRFSPNNSLFVNTSSMSLPTEDGLDYKILHHRSGLSDSFSTNGSPNDKKRKLDLEESHSSKKQKTESESSFFQYIDKPSQGTA